MLTLTKPPTYDLDSPVVFHLSSDPAWDHARVEAEKDTLAVAAACIELDCEPAELAERLERTSPEHRTTVNSAQKQARARHPVARWLGGEGRYSAEATLDLPAELAATPTAVTIGHYLEGTPTGFAIRPLPHAKALQVNRMLNDSGRSWTEGGWVAFAVRWGLVGLKHFEGDFELTRGPDGALDEATIDALDRVQGLLFELGLAILALTNNRDDPREGKR